MNNTEIELLIDNLVVLDADSRTIVLNNIFHNYGSEIYKQVVHQLVIKLKEEGLTK